MLPAGRTLPQCSLNSGPRSSLETDAEVALKVRRFGERGLDGLEKMNYAASLRRDLGCRAERYARNHGLPYCLSYGQPPTVCFERYCDGTRHGNFLPSTYKAILRNPNWRRRLQNVSYGNTYSPVTVETSPYRSLTVRQRIGAVVSSLLTIHEHSYYGLLSMRYCC
jgi:hypothetical protein